MSPWHAALKRSSTLRAYFARIADSVPQNTATNVSIIERLVLRRLVFENTPALAVQRADERPDRRGCCNETTQSHLGCKRIPQQITLAFVIDRSVTLKTR